jgi:DNA-binding IclR family transcriptional regulator
MTGVLFSRTPARIDRGSRTAVLAARKVATVPPPSAAVSSVERALAVLEAFQDDDNSLTLAELARRTGLYKSTILRLIESLERRNFIMRLDNGQYQLGAALVRLGELSKRSTRLGDQVLPVLTRLADTTGESAVFYVRYGDQRFCLFRIDSRRTVRAHIRQGDLLPMRGAPGRVFLHFDRERARRPVGATHLLPTLRTSPGRLVPIMTQGEVDPDLATVACPVFGAGDRLVGVVAVSGPANRFGRDTAAAIGERVLEECRRLTVALGGDPARFGSEQAAAPRRRKPGAA